MQTFKGVLYNLLLKVENRASELGWDSAKTDKVLWDIITVLRGPDAGNGKKTVTGRVRSLIGITDENKARGLTLNTNAPDVGDTVQEVLDSADVEEHYKEHVKLAVKAVKELFEVDLLEDSRAKLGQRYEGHGRSYVVADMGGDKFNFINISTGKKYFSYHESLKGLGERASRYGLTLA